MWQMFCRGFERSHQRSKVIAMVKVAYCNAAVLHCCACTVVLLFCSVELLFGIVSPELGYENCAVTNSIETNCSCNKLNV